MFLQGPDTTWIGLQSVSPGNPTLTVKIPNALQLLWEQGRESGARQPGWSLMGSALLTLEQRALRLPKPWEIQSSAIGLSLPVLQPSEAHFSSKEPPGKLHVSPSLKFSNGSQGFQNEEITPEPANPGAISLIHYSLKKQGS